MQRRFGALISTLLFSVLASGLLSGQAQAYTTSSAPSAIIALNAQRAANGIPAISLNQTLLKPTCTLENHWIASGSDQWSANSSPWDNAPFHQDSLYNPALDQAGYGVYGPSESSFPGLGSPTAWTCMWFSFAPDTVGRPHFYQLLNADGNNTEVPISEQAAEYPTTPAAMLHLPPTTGPNILVYAGNIGDESSITSVSMINDGNDQAVAVTDLDDQNFYHGQGSLVDPSSGIVVPERPLSYNTTYTVTVNWQGNDVFTGLGQPATQTFTFTTVRQLPDLTSVISPLGSTAVSAVSTNPAPVTVTLTRLGQRYRASVPASSVTQQHWLSLPPRLHGRYHLCLSQTATTRFAALETCSSIVVNTSSRAPGLSGIQARISANRLRISATPAGRWRGARLVFSSVPTRS
jgi:hypothetical protein